MDHGRLSESIHVKQDCIPAYHPYVHCLCLVQRSRHILCDLRINNVRFQRPGFGTPVNASIIYRCMMVIFLSEIPNTKINFIFKLFYFSTLHMPIYEPLCPILVVMWYRGSVNFVRWLHSWCDPSCLGLQPGSDAISNHVLYPLSYPSNPISCNISWNFWGSRISDRK